MRCTYCCTKEKPECSHQAALTQTAVHMTSLLWNFQKRAQICVDYMVAKGIEPKRLVALGMGETEPFEMDVKGR